MPTPYALSSDLVSAWPAKSLEIATYLDTSLAAKTDLAMVKNAQTGLSYSYALADQTKLLTMSNASANTVLVTKQATVAWAADTQLRVLNIGAGATTLVADTGVTINNNTALAQWRGGVLIRMSSDVWTFVPFASGVGAANFSDAATGTYTGFKYKTFTASGTLTVSQAGFVDIVLVGGGAAGGGGAGASGGGYGGGGAGGCVVLSNYYLAEGTYTITIGAGGASQSTGGGTDSTLGALLTAFGGGSGVWFDSGMAMKGGSGGGGIGQAGAAARASTGARGASNQGNSGGNGPGTAAGGGGGGAAAVGANGVSTTGGAGGAGTTTTIAGTTPSGAYVAGSYAFGGGGGGGGSTGGGAGGTGGGGAGATGAATAGIANTGGGGGGSSGTAAAGVGGMGILIVRVAV